MVLRFKRVKNEPKVVFIFKRIKNEAISGFHVWTSREWG